MHRNHVKRVAFIGTRSKNNLTFLGVQDQNLAVMNGNVCCVTERWNFVLCYRTFPKKRWMHIIIIIRIIIVVVYIFYHSLSNLDYTLSNSRLTRELRFGMNFEGSNILPLKYTTFSVHQRQPFHRAFCLTYSFKITLRSLPLKSSSI